MNRLGATGGGGGGQRWKGVFDCKGSFPYGLNAMQGWRLEGGGCGGGRSDGGPSHHKYKSRDISEGGDGGHSHHKNKSPKQFL